MHCQLLQTVTWELGQRVCHVSNQRRSSRGLLATILAAIYPTSPHALFLSPDRPRPAMSRRERVQSCIKLHFKHYSETCRRGSNCSPENHEMHLFICLFIPGHTNNHCVIIGRFWFFTGFLSRFQCYSCRRETLFRLWVGMFFGYFYNM